METEDRGQVRKKEKSEQETEKQRQDEDHGVQQGEKQQGGN